MADDDIMMDEDLFGGFDEPKKAQRKGRARDKKPEKLFTAVKVKMVMRIHGVSRAQALEIIAQREKEAKAAEGEEADRSTAEGRDGEFMSARKFFIE